MTTAPSAVGSGRQRHLLAQAQAAAAALRELSPDAPADQVLPSLPLQVDIPVSPHCPQHRRSPADLRHDVTR